jgi:pimeloyl-ACP methyl ester carboxylesterase
VSAKTFVLVHGAWHGGWAWRRVVDRLSARGHRAFAPTLTGLGDRAHLLRPGIDLSLHIADVLGVIKYEQLRNFVLVGHSYGGCVISGIAEVMPDATDSLVFLDAFIPDNGDSTFDLVQPAVQEVIRGARERMPKKAYIRASGYPNVSFEKAHARAKADPTWRTYEVPCGHDVMIDEPERLTEILLEVG